MRAMNAAERIASRYIPKGHELVAGDAGGTAVYAGETAGKAYAIAYAGTAGRPTWHYSFKSAEARDKHVAEWMAERTAAEAATAARKAKARAGHTLELGAILSTCWGYNMTNVEFYEVVELHGKTEVSLRRLASKVVEETGYLSGTVVPVPGEYVADALAHMDDAEAPIRKRVGPGNTCKMAHWGRHASPWNGKPAHFNHCD